MLQKNEMLGPPEGPPTGVPAPEVVSSTTRRPTRWPWITGAALVVVLAAAAVLWWQLDSTVSQDRYDETVAELTVSEEALADAQDDAAELQNRLTSARAVAQFLAYWSLDYLPEDVAAMQNVGDTATADAVLRQLGETGTWIEWVEGDGWLHVGNSIAQIDDEALSSAWTRWLGAEIGSVEEMTAYAELEQRVAYLMLDALADA